MTEGEALPPAEVRGPSTLASGRFELGGAARDSPPRNEERYRNGRTPVTGLSEAPVPPLEGAKRGELVSPGATVSMVGHIAGRCRLDPSGGGAVSASRIGSALVAPDGQSSGVFEERVHVGALLPAKA